MKQAKPILHGRDHGPGGSDGIPSTGVTDGSPLVADATTGYVKWGTAGGGSGIQFNTDPQTGDWLKVSTTDGNPSMAGGSSGRGILLESTDAIGGIEIRVNVEDTGTSGNLDLTQYSTTNDLNIYTDVTDINITAQGLVGILARTDGVNIEAEAGSDVIIEASGSSGRVMLRADGSGGRIFASVNDLIDLSSYKDIVITVDADLSSPTGNLKLVNLPTSAPGFANCVWNNGGVLNIT